MEGVQEREREEEAKKERKAERHPKRKQSQHTSKQVNNTNARGMRCVEENIKEHKVNQSLLVA